MVVIATRGVAGHAVAPLEGEDVRRLVPTHVLLPRQSESGSANPILVPDLVPHRRIGEQSLVPDLDPRQRREDLVPVPGHPPRRKKNRLPFKSLPLPWPENQTNLSNRKVALVTPMTTNVAHDLHRCELRSEI